ncbi:hypothetical protein [Humibacter sp. RRB41]|uniref:hypothetical protein n=1 Tax=Humibacter sp. RRB41 TaxID=2919946 RepID=UPI001FAADC3A|nr:hypothetical protein [Humibacter sp. RRB41]
MSGFAWTLAEWLVTLTTGAWLELHASPAPTILIVGVIVVLAISSMVAVRRLVAIVAPRRVTASTAPQLSSSATVEPRIVAGSAPVGGRGARAPAPGVGRFA